MNRATITLDLNLDSQMGKTVFAGLASAIGGVELTVTQEARECHQVMEVPKDEPKQNDTPVVDEAPPKQRAPRAKAKPEVESPTQPEATETEATETEATETEATETDVTLGDIKAEIAKKVAKNRVEIKAKLTEFGVDNSDKLAEKKPEKMLEFYKFLIDLD